MMSINTKSSFDRSDGNIYSQSEQHDTVVNVTRELRRIKRRLLLEHAGVSLPSVLERKPKGVQRYTSDSTEASFSSMTPSDSIRSVGSAPGSPRASSMCSPVD